VRRSTKGLQLCSSKMLYWRGEWGKKEGKRKKGDVKRKGELLLAKKDQFQEGQRGGEKKKQN